jgi:hypothetical protein
MPSAHAQNLLAARSRRVRAVRRRIAAAVVAAFLLAWGVIAGYGPMGTTTAASQVAAASTSGSEAAAPDDSGTLTTRQS